MQQPRIGFAQTRKFLHMPEMILVCMHLALCCQEMKRSDLQIVHSLNCPAVPAVSLDVLIDGTVTILKSLEQMTAAVVSSIFFTQYAHSGGKRFLSGGARRCVLMLQQVLGFAGPRHYLRIETDPGGFEFIPPPR